MIQQEYSELSWGPAPRHSPCSAYRLIKNCLDGGSINIGYRTQTDVKGFNLRFGHAIDYHESVISGAVT